MQNGTLLESLGINADLVSVDFNSDQTGGWQQLAGASGVEAAYLLLVKPAGVAGDDLSIKLEQARDTNGTGAKAFRFSRIFHKIGTASRFTAVNLETPTDDLDLALVNSADLLTDVSKAIIVVEVRARALDVTNGFSCVRVFYDGSDIANALVGTSLWLASNPQYSQVL